MKPVHIFPSGLISEHTALKIEETDTSNPKKAKRK
jgi:hypothetical protein